MCMRGTQSQYDNVLSENIVRDGRAGGSVAVAALMKAVRKINESILEQAAENRQLPF